jgi:hypothetical protein
MIAWLRKRREYRALVECDAAELIECFGESAYYEARERAHHQPETIDANRPPGHWAQVQAEIAKRTGKTIGLSGRDRGG